MNESSVSDTTIRAIVEQERDKSLVFQTGLEMVVAGIVQGLIVLFTVAMSSIITGLYPTGVAYPIILLFQGFLFYLCIRLTSHFILYWNADILNLFVGIFLPLFSSDEKGFQGFFWKGREHRWGDTWTALWTRTFWMACVYGGWLIALVSWNAIPNVSGASYTLGTPVVDFVTVGWLTIIAFFFIIAAMTTFAYATYSRHVFVTDNAHLRKYVAVIKHKGDRNPDAPYVSQFALYKTGDYVVCMLFTQGASPLILELLLAGGTLESTAHNLGWFVGGRLLGLAGILFYVLCVHHVLYDWAKRENKSKDNNMDGGMTGAEAI